MIFLLIVNPWKEVPLSSTQTPQLNTSVQHKDYTFFSPKIRQFNTQKASVQHKKPSVPHPSVQKKIVLNSPGFDVLKWKAGLRKLRILFPLIINTFSWARKRCAYYGKSAYLGKSAYFGKWRFSYLTYSLYRIDSSIRIELAIYFSKILVFPRLAHFR